MYLKENCIAYIVYRCLTPFANDRNRTRKAQSFFYVAEHVSDDATQVHIVPHMGPVPHRGTLFPLIPLRRRLRTYRGNSGHAGHSTLTWKSPNILLGAGCYQVVPSTHRLMFLALSPVLSVMNPLRLQMTSFSTYLSVI